MLDRVEAMERELQDRGHRLTVARQVIMEVLVSSKGHLSADELAEAARGREPGIGRMTVYRTLDLLSQLGLIRPVYQGAGAARYVLLENGRHHHLICSQCDQVLEFDDCVLGEIEQALGGRYGFYVKGHLLELYGLCERCQG